jgi:hypothetical protein
MRTVELRSAALAGLVFTGASVVGAAPAVADAPTKTTYPVRFASSTVVSCDTFAVRLEELAGEFTDIAFTDKAGEFTRNIRHASLSGVLRNSKTGYELPYRVKRTAIFDAATGTITVTGLSRQVRLPGGGVVALAAGREIAEFSQFPPTTTSSSGRSIAEFESQLCDLLRGP